MRIKKRTANVKELSRKKIYRIQRTERTVDCNSGNKAGQHYKIKLTTNYGSNTARHCS